MTIRHIKIFLSVFQNGCSATKAAESLHMTQPAVSLAIHELEQYYGVILFDRIERRLKITEAGLRFQTYAAHISALFDDMERGMRDWDAFGLLRVGASITIGSQLLPHYVKTYCNLYPGTEVKVWIAPSEQLEKKIIDNELDFALIEGVPHTDVLISEEYMEDRLVVIGPADEAFPKKKKMTIGEFQQQKFLLRERGSGTREVFDRVIESAGFSVSPVWEAMSTTALVNAVINGLGIAVLPRRMAAEPLERGMVAEIQVEGLDFFRKFRIIYHKDKYLTSAAKAFIELCRNFEAAYPAPPCNGLY